LGADTLLYVNFDVVGVAEDVSLLDFTGNCVLGDPFGNPIPDVSFVDGRCAIAAGSAGVGVGTGPSRDMLRVLQNPVYGEELEIMYALAEAGRVELGLYDVGGRVVRRLLDERKDAGEYRTRWNLRTDAGGTVASGIYYLEIRTPGYRATQKIVVMR